MIVLPAIWLLVIGYGLLYVGYRNQSGHPTSFAEAFFGQAAPATPPLSPIQATGSSSGFSGPGAVAGGGGGGGGGAAW